MMAYKILVVEKSKNSEAAVPAALDKSSVSLKLFLESVILPFLDGKWQNNGWQNNDLMRAKPNLRVD